MIEEPPFQKRKGGSFFMDSGAFHKSKMDFFVRETFVHLQRYSSVL